MPLPRSRVMPDRPVWTHVVSRCVRKAYLCGGRDGRWDHRRQWLEDRLRELSGVFAVEIAAYAVMSNHVHVVQRMAPEIAATWSALEVAERWLVVFGKNAGRMQLDGDLKAAAQALAANVVWIAQKRERLADLSWFMRAFKESLARRANAEEKCSGRFWEGRFVSVPLLDQAALIACMAYVDLNPVRVRMADTPENSTHTSVRQRVRARRRHRTVMRVQAEVAANTLTPEVAVESLRIAGVPDEQRASAATSPEAGMFVTPMARCLHPTEEFMAPRPMPLDEYLLLVDLTGRVVRPGKRGAIDPRLPAILARLDLSLEAWIATMTGWRQMHGSGVGARAGRDGHAADKGLRWIRNRCALFAADQRVA